jgi:hypothetical protein
MEYSSHYDGELDVYLRNSEAQRKLIKQQQQKAEVHVYRAEDYGLTKELIEREFAPYIDKYC